MGQLLSILSLAFALSMDAFSLSLGVGTFSPSSKKIIILSTIVGIMHFMMPLAGSFLGTSLIKTFSLNANFLVGVILLFLAFEMVLEIIQKNDTEQIDLSIFGCFAFAFGVSLDSFSIGLGIKALYQNVVIPFLCFSIFSFIFTFLGLSIGRYTTKLLGTSARILGAILLVFLGIMYLCK